MKIQIPTECPSCNSELQNVNGQLFCRNTSACLAQSSKLVENYCKKMKIKGFGAKTVKKLELHTIAELYTIPEQRLTEILGDTMGPKLFTEITNSKSSEFATVLGSLGIKLIGKVAAEKLAAKISNFHQISLHTCKVAGLGEKATDSLVSWANSSDGMETIGVLSSQIAFTEKSPAQDEQVEHKFDVCITGKLDDFTSRSKAADYLSKFGITVKNSVTKTVQYLVCEDDTKVNSSSYKKAQANGISILSIKQLIGELK